MQELSNDGFPATEAVCLQMRQFRLVLSIRPNPRNLRFAMLAEFDQQLANTLAEIRSQGLYKTERIITSPQDAQIEITGGDRVLNMCANNYLGLADHPALIAAAKEALDTHGLRHGQRPFHLRHAGHP